MDDVTGIFDDDLETDEFGIYRDDNDVDIDSLVTGALEQEFLVNDAGIWQDDIENFYSYSYGGGDSGIGTVVDVKSNSLRGNASPAVGNPEIEDDLTDKESIRNDEEFHISELEVSRSASAQGSELVRTPGLVELDDGGELQLPELANGYCTSESNCTTTAASPAAGIDGGKTGPMHRKIATGNSGLGVVEDRGYDSDDCSFEIGTKTYTVASKRLVNGGSHSDHDLFSPRDLSGSAIWSTSPVGKSPGAGGKMQDEDQNSTDEDEDIREFEQLEDALHRQLRLEESPTEEAGVSPCSDSGRTPVQGQGSQAGNAGGGVSSAMSQNHSEHSRVSNSNQEIVAETIGEHVGKPSKIPMLRSRSASLSRPGSRSSRPGSRCSRPGSRCSRPGSRCSRPVSRGLPETISRYSAKQQQVPETTLSAANNRVSPKDSSLKKAFQSGNESRCSSDLQKVTRPISNISQQSQPRTEDVNLPVETGKHRHQQQQSPDQMKDLSYLDHAAKLLVDDMLSDHDDIVVTNQQHRPVSQLSTNQKVDHTTVQPATVNHQSRRSSSLDRSRPRTSVTKNNEPRRRSATTEDFHDVAGNNSSMDESEDGGISREQLRLRFIDEMKKRRLHEQTAQQLQRNYENLLRSHAEKELTIEQLRLGARITLHVEPPAPLQGVAGSMPAPQRSLSFNIPKAGVASIGSTAQAARPQQAQISYIEGISQDPAQVAPYASGVKISLQTSAASTPTVLPSVTSRVSSVSPAAVTDSLLSTTDAKNAVLLSAANAIKQQMSAFEILLDQDPNLKLDEQEKVLRSIAVAYSKLQSDHRTMGLGEDNGSGNGMMEDDEMELELELAQLDSCLSHLTTRVEENLQARMTGIPYLPGPVKVDHSINVSSMSASNSISAPGTVFHSPSGTGTTSVTKSAVKQLRDPLPWTLDDIPHESSWQPDAVDPVPGRHYDNDTDVRERLTVDGIISSLSLIQQQQQEEEDDERDADTELQMKPAATSSVNNSLSADHNLSRTSQHTQHTTDCSLNNSVVSRQLNKDGRPTDNRRREPRISTSETSASELRRSWNVKPDHKQSHTSSQDEAVNGSYSDDSRSHSVERRTSSRRLPLTTASRHGQVPAATKHGRGPADRSSKDGRGLVGKEGHAGREDKDSGYIGSTMSSNYTQPSTHNRQPMNKDSRRDNSAYRLLHTNACSPDGTQLYTDSSSEAGSNDTVEERRREMKASAAAGGGGGRGGGREGNLLSPLSPLSSVTQEKEQDNLETPHHSYKRMSNSRDQSETRLKSCNQPTANQQQPQPVIIPQPIPLHPLPQAGLVMTSSAAAPAAPHQYMTSLNPATAGLVGPQYQYFPASQPFVFPVQTQPPSYRFLPGVEAARYFTRQPAPQLVSHPVGTGRLAHEVPPGERDYRYQASRQAEIYDNDRWRRDVGGRSRRLHRRLYRDDLDFESTENDDMRPKIRSRRSHQDHTNRRQPFTNKDEAQDRHYEDRRWYKDYGRNPYHSGSPYRSGLPLYEEDRPLPAMYFEPTPAPVDYLAPGGDHQTWLAQSGVGMNPVDMANQFVPTQSRGIQNVPLVNSTGVQYMVDTSAGPTGPYINAGGTGTYMLPGNGGGSAASGGGANWSGGSGRPVPVPPGTTVVSDGNPVVITGSSCPLCGRTDYHAHADYSTGATSQFTVPSGVTGGGVTGVTGTGGVINPGVAHQFHLLQPAQQLNSTSSQPTLVQTAQPLNSVRCYVREYGNTVSQSATNVASRQKSRKFAVDTTIDESESFDDDLNTSLSRAVKTAQRLHNLSQRMRTSLKNELSSGKMFQNNRITVDTY